jgi:hypothetical protein
MEILIIVTCASLLIAALAVNGNRSLAKDCRRMRNDYNELRGSRNERESADWKIGYDRDSETKGLRDRVIKAEGELGRLSSDYGSRHASQAREIHSLELELRKYKLAEFSDRPLVVGELVRVKGRPIYGTLLRHDGTVWTVRTHGDPNARIDIVFDNDYDESLLEREV